MPTQQAGVKMTFSKMRILTSLAFVIAIGAATMAADGQPLMCNKGKLVFEESFSSGKLDARWSAAKGDWKIVDAVLQGAELKSDKHAASIRTDFELPEALVMQFDFKFDGGSVIHCSFNGKGHICRATINPQGFILKGEKVKNDADDKAVTVGQVQQEFVKGQWYTMQIEIAGDEFVARVDDGPVAFGSHAKIARAKTNFGFPMAGVSSQIDNIKIWTATSNPNWAETKSKLPVNKIVPPTPPTPQQRFALLDKNHDASLSLEEFIGNRPAEKREAAKKQFQRKDKDAGGTLSLSEYVATGPGK
jgi:hypothetical protein